MVNKSHKKNHWAHKKERGSVAGVYFFVYTYKIIGSIGCKLIMLPVLLYFYLFNPSARKNLALYLDKISKYPEVDVKVSQWNVFKIIINFGFGIVDKLSAWTGKITIKHLNTVHDTDFRACEKEGKGGLLLISHLGNFEICRVASEERSSAKLNVFMHTKNSQKFSKVIKSLNSKYDISIIQGDELNLTTVMVLKEKIDAGEFIVIAGDRIPVKNSNGTQEVSFLGSKAQFPIGPFVLAKVLECPIITLYCLKNKKKYDVYFDLLIEQISFNRKNRHQVLQQSLEKYVSNLEFYAQKAPLQWYNFHNFWVN